MAAFFVNQGSFFISLSLVFIILLYDGMLKKNIWLGPFCMGACRYLNLLLGFSVSPLIGSAFFLPILNGIFIFGVTVLSIHETEENGSNFHIFITIVSMVALCVVYIFLFKFEIASQKTGLILCMIWAFSLIVYLLPLLFTKTAALIQKRVKVLILSIVILDGIIVAGTGQIYWSFFVWVLLVPSVIFANRFYVT